MLCGATAGSSCCRASAAAMQGQGCPPGIHVDNADKPLCWATACNVLPVFAGAGEGIRLQEGAEGLQERWAYILDGNALCLQAPVLCHSDTALWVPHSQSSSDPVNYMLNCLRFVIVVPQSSAATGQLWRTQSWGKSSSCRATSARMCPRFWCPTTSPKRT